MGGAKKPLREARGLTPWFWARTGLEPGLSREGRSRTRPSQGASSMCQPTGRSDDGLVNRRPQRNILPSTGYLASLVPWLSHRPILKQGLPWGNRATATLSWVPAMMTSLSERTPKLFSKQSLPTFHFREFSQAPKLPELKSSPSFPKLPKLYSQSGPP